MYNKIIDYLENKHVAILGFGMEGISTYNFIRRHSDMHLTIVDKDDVYEPNKEILQGDDHVNYVIGDEYLENLDEYDIVIKSPGVVTKDIDISNIKFSSQLELLLKFNRENVIGITGTKGKSTTTTLIYEILRANSLDARLLGNMGIPLFDDIETVTEESKLVIEMAELQLEFVTYSPHIGIILNMFEEHLDFFGTVEYYHESTLNMFKYQNEKDYMIYFSDIEPLNTYISDEYKGRPYRAQMHNKNITSQTAYIYRDMISLNQKELFDINTEVNIIGEHNLRNIMVSLIVSSILELDLKKTVDTIINFKSLKHRIELVGTYNGVIYYDDAIATIPSATIHAVNALKKVDTLIFGGLDRGIDYEEFIEFLNTGIVKNLICMPSTGTKISLKIKNKDIEKYEVETLEEAVKIADEVTKKEHICLLSPAAASYEYYKNFMEKGSAYQNLVKGL